MTFCEYTYKRPDVEGMLSAIEKMTKNMTAASSAEEQIAIIKELDQICADYNTMNTICMIRHTINTRDTYYKEENTFFDENGPRVSNAVNGLMSAVMNSAFRAELEERLGSFFFEKQEYNAKSMTEEIIPLMQEENVLASRYNELYASAQIPFMGQVLTVEQMVPYKASPDREVRRAAYQAEGEFFDSHRAEFDEIYDSLVKNRTAQAKALGYENFIPLGNIRMRRFGYGADEVKYFRSQVVEHLVPVVDRIKAMQADRIGVGADFKAYDDLVLFADRNAMPKGSPAELKAKAQKMFGELSKETKEFFDFMMEHELLDVESKQGKAPGGYCATLDNYKAPFIFSNFNGSHEDVVVLTHESGHAFESYVGTRIDFEVDAHRNYSSESAEVHSMAMEFLTQRWHEMFFEEDTAKFELQHNEHALSFIPYSCIIDAFQYSAYENPQWTPEERNKEWQRLLTVYQPYLTDYEDIPFYSRGGGWQYKLHTYLYPLYYIDYALAEVVALQLYLMDLEDHEKAWETYYRFVCLAGTMRFADAVKACGLKSPFEPGCVKEVAEQVMVWIEKHQM